MLPWTLFVISLLVNVCAWWMIDKYTLKIRQDQHEKNRLMSLLGTRAHEIEKLKKQLNSDRPYIEQVRRQRAASRLPR